MSTESQRQQWRELADAATPGEWGTQTNETIIYGTRFINTGVWGGTDGVTFVCDCGTGKGTAADAAFIAAARAAVPALLAALERVEAERDALAAELERVRGELANDKPEPMLWRASKHPLWTDDAQA